MRYEFDEKNKIVIIFNDKNEKLILHDYKYALMMIDFAKDNDALDACLSDVFDYLSGFEEYDTGDESIAMSEIMAKHNLLLKDIIDIKKLEKIFEKIYCKLGININEPLTITMNPFTVYCDEKTLLSI